MGFFDNLETVVSDEFVKSVDDAVKCFFISKGINNVVVDFDGGTNDEKIYALFNETGYDYYNPSNNTCIGFAKLEETIKPSDFKYAITVGSYDPFADSNSKGGIIYHLN